MSTFVPNMGSLALGVTELFSIFEKKGFQFFFGCVIFLVLTDYLFFEGFGTRKNAFFSATKRPTGLKLCTQVGKSVLGPQGDFGPDSGQGG